MTVRAVGVLGAGLTARALHIPDFAATITKMIMIATIAQPHPPDAILCTKSMFRPFRFLARIIPFTACDFNAPTPLLVCPRKLEAHESPDSKGRNGRRKNMKNY